MDQSDSAAGIDWRPVVLLVALTALCLLPFADKPFHIDDSFFVQVAQQIHEAPHDPYGFDMYWTGHVVPVWMLNQNPPGISYVIALAATLVGWSELALHLVFMLPAAAAVAGTWLLARRACAHPFLAALTMLITPVFWLSSTQLMADTLLLCFWVWAVLFWVEGLERDKPLLLAVAGILIALACSHEVFGDEPDSPAAGIFAVSATIDRLVGYNVFDSNCDVVLLRNIHTILVRCGPGDGGG
ncbi:MAG: glycosyltransferase family 39 protein [Gammaproteobacteria bacterium]|nr:glycosyltransferase family 39 protein [Gammaproteobacteria bacterium]